MVREAHPPTPPPWPRSVEELEHVQSGLGEAAARLLHTYELLTDLRGRRIAGCFVCFGRGGGGQGAAGDRGWAAAACRVDDHEVGSATVAGEAAAAYDPGHLALREGPLLEAAVLALDPPPDLILVNATGRDHPRRAGLGLHLGARLDIPTIGITNRLLIAVGDWPEDVAGVCSPFRVADETVGYWLRIRRGVRPIAVHAGWRVDPEAALESVLACIRRARTPEPLRSARRLAREARERESHVDARSKRSGGQLPR